MPGLVLHLASGEAMKFAPATYLKHMQRQIYEAECAAALVDQEESKEFGELEKKIASYHQHLYSSVPQEDDTRQWQTYREIFEPQLKIQADELTAIAQKLLEEAKKRPWYTLIEVNRMLLESHRLEDRAGSFTESDPSQAIVLNHQASLLFQDAVLRRDFIIHSLKSKK